MAERPPILARGRVARVFTPDRLYEIEMPNGHRAYGVIERKGPRPPAGVEVIGLTVMTHFSPYDFSKCKVVAWETASS
jgi:hypothetical protein